MKFTRQQIEWAIELKKLGIPWNPGTGHYAYDSRGEIGPGSPFQNAVYFFLDYPCFVEYFESETNLVRRMVWLPTLEQAIEVAKEYQVPSDEIERALINGIRRSDELTELYQLLAGAIGADGIYPENDSHDARTSS